MNGRKYSSFNTECPPNLLIDGARRHSMGMLVDALYSSDVVGYEIGRGFDTSESTELSSYPIPEPTRIKVMDSDSIEVVKSFRLLEDDWNGYGADRPSEQAIEHSIQLIRAIESYGVYKVDICYPLDNGGVQIDVSSSSFAYELEVLDDSINLLKFAQDNSLIETITLPLETIASVVNYF